METKKNNLFKKYIFFILIASCLFSCDNHKQSDVVEEDLPVIVEEDPLEIIEEEPHEIVQGFEIPTHLPSTKWKLEGIVDVQTNTIKELEPKDYERCYTLTLYSDGTFTGYTSRNKFVCVFESSTGNVRLLLITEINEQGDGSLFYNTLLSVQSHTQQEHELKLFYNDKMNYLLYKKNE